MKKYSVTIAVDVPSYGAITVEAETAAAALALVSSQIADDPDPFYKNESFDPEMQFADGLRAVDAIEL